MSESGNSGQRSRISPAHVQADIMGMNTSRKPAAVLVRASNIIAILCAVAGAVALVGWIIDSPVLTRQSTGRTFIAPNTAAVFIIGGIAILLLNMTSRLARSAGRIAGALIAAFSIATLAEYLFNVNLGIDTLLLPSRMASWTITPTPGRFALQSALAFSFAGLAIALTDVKWKKMVVSELTSAIVFLIGFFGVLGWVYQANLLHGVMAPETAAIMALLSLALLMRRPQTGTMSLVASEGSAGIVARRLLLATAVVLPFLGWLQVQVGANRWMDREPRNALFAAAGVLAVWLLVLSAARAIEIQEDRLRESEERFRTLSASSPVGIFLADPQGAFLYANPRCSVLCGFGDMEFSGNLWLDYVHPEDYERVSRSWESAVLQQVDWMQEVRWGSDPGRVHWTICRGAPMRSETGELIGYAGTIEDVTERKLAEMSLRKTEKLAAMGRLAGTIAHEINNPLEALSNLFFLLQSHSSLDGTAREYARMADQQLARISTITKQSLAFYRESAKATLVPLAEILGEVLDFYREIAHGQNVQVERQFDTDGVIIAHAGELRQVFANLVGNAVQAMPSGGTLRIHLFPASQRENGTRTGIRVNIIDTGAGIPPQVASRLFEPFFTTKAEKGTGLGLWVSRGIVEKYEGAIRFRSAKWPRAITCFSVFLPTVIQQTRKPKENEVSGERVSAQKA